LYEPQKVHVLLEHPMVACNIKLRASEGGLQIEPS
jgi:hypothetical protein